MGFSSNIHDVNMEQCVLAALMTTALSLETIGQELMQSVLLRSSSTNIQGNRRAIRKQLSV